MNRKLVVSAFIAAITAIIHIFAGGADVAAPLLNSALSAEPKLTLYAVWHMVSVVLILSAIAFFIGGLPKHAQAARYLIVFISILWCVFGLVFLVVINIQPDDGWLFKLPQWMLLIPVGFLGLWVSANKANSADAKSRAAD
jgi:hypothetical protein